MSVANACNAISTWTESYGVTNDHDLSPFITGALLVALADTPASDAELDLIAQMQQCLTGQELTMETLGAELKWIEENGVDGAVEGIVNNITADNERELLVLMAALVATVERGVNAQEGTMLQKIGQALGFSQLEVQKLLGKSMQAAQGNF
jgi:tellurite resistance protein